MKYKIISTSEEYIEGFHAALDSVARERKYISFLEAPHMENLKRFVRNNIERGSIQYLAIMDDQVIGWCDISKSDRDIYNHTGSLGIGVIKDYRNKGIGSALIQKALDAAKEQGLTRIELTVRGNNSRARKIYDKFGFKVEGLKKNAVLLDGVYEDVTVMALLFDN